MKTNDFIDETQVMGLNRKRFVEEILNLDFNGSIRSCAISIGMNPSYLHDLIFIPTKDAGIKTLTKIYHYCKRTGKDPERFIFKQRR
ncbi:MAG: hypothetical protein ABFD79_00335 [Phycisphaerales bacterium]